MYHNEDGVVLKEPFEKDGVWYADDGWGCDVPFKTYDEAHEFQKHLDYEYIEKIRTAED